MSSICLVYCYEYLTCFPNVSDPFCKTTISHVLSYLKLVLLFLHLILQVFVLLLAPRELYLDVSEALLELLDFSFSNLYRLSILVLMCLSRRDK